MSVLMLFGQSAHSLVLGFMVAVALLSAWISNTATTIAMMPVATPPNAIIFGSERVSIRQMCRAGLVLNLIGVILVTLAMYFIAQPILHFDGGSLPAWARN